MKVLTLEWEYEFVIHWMRYGFSHYFVQCLRGLSRTSNHQYNNHREGILAIVKMYKHVMVNPMYVGSEKRNPDEIPQVCYADEVHYDSKHARCPMEEGERGMLMLQLLVKQFLVYICNLFEHTRKNNVDKFVANGLIQGLHELIIGEITYAPSVADAPLSRRSSSEYYARVRSIAACESMREGGC